MTWRRLFRGKSQTPSAIEIVNTFGGVLEHQSYNLFGGAPSSDLPFEKQVIKSAILELATSPDVTPEQSDALQAGFCSLAAYQDSFANFEPFDPDALMKRIERGEDIAEVAKAIGDENPASGSVILEESALLQSEWNAKVGRNA